MRLDLARMSGSTLRILVLMVAMGAALALPAAQADRARTEADLRKLTQRIQQVQRQVQQDAVEKNKLTRDLRDAEKAVAGAQGELTRLRNERSQRAEAREALAEERAAREADLERTQQELEKQLRAAYFMGRNEPLKLLLNQRSPGEFSRNVAYYGYLGRLRAQQIARIEEDVARIEQLTADIEAEDARLAELEEDQKERVAELDTARKRRGQVLARLEKESSSRAASLRRMRSERTQLERLLEQLERATRSLPYDPDAPFARTRGRLHWPVSGKLIVNYGATISGLGKSEHIEIDTKYGATVNAIHEGRVIHADWLPGRGQLVIIDHGNGYWSLYGHLAEMFRQEGATVRGGEAIGTAGESGGRKNAGLYFELRRSGKPIDPRGWFRSPAPPAG